MYTDNIGIQIKLKEPTKTFMMIEKKLKQIEKNPIGLHGLYKNISAFEVFKIGLNNKEMTRGDVVYSIM